MQNQWSCAKQPSETTTISYPDSTLSLAPERAAELAQQILKETNTSIIEGLELSLWASDSLMADPIAISIDDQGGIYYTQGNRILTSEFDIRGHRPKRAPAQRRILFFSSMPEVFCQSNLVQYSTFLDDSSLNRDGKAITMPYRPLPGKNERTIGLGHV